MWRWVVGLLAVIGCSTAVATLPVDAVVGTAVLAALIAVTVVATRRSDRSRGLARDLGVAAAVGAFGGVGLIGFATLIGFGVVLIGVGLVASSPWAVRRLASRWKGWQRFSIGSEPALEMDRCVGEMTDQELCRAWRLSHELMRSCTRVTRRAQLASRRQSYLDEIERRHPAEFTCWLYGNASPANDPGRYLSSTD